MQRIRTVLIKLTELAQRNSDRSLIDVDLMLDYTRVLYADLLEIRGSMADRVPALKEPTLDEVTAAIENKRPIETQVQIPAFAQEQAPMAASIPTPEPIKVPTPPPPPPIKPPVSRGDIREYIDLNDKYLFLGEFFGNDLRAYEEAMTYLNGLNSEAEALHYLGHKLQDNDSANAIKNVINRFYAG